jgi:predicted permease
VLAVLEGFSTIVAVIALGVLVAHIGLADLGWQRMLSRVSFFVASPALLLTVLADADVANVLSRHLLASAAGVVASALVYLAAARLVWHRDLADTTIGTLSACYVNAGNLGIPIAAYVLGDAALVAPTLLMQLLVMQPLALGVLDSTRRGSVSVRRLLVRPFTNPLTVGSLIGLVLAIGGWEIPRGIRDPLDLVGGMAVPAMLMAYGISLRLGPRPGRDASIAEVGYITVCKMALQPAVAATCAWLLGLRGEQLLAVAVLSALPTAQNIFVHATRYDRSVTLARDAIFATTVLSLPVIFVLAALLA